MPGAGAIESDAGRVFTASWEGEPPECWATMGSLRVTLKVQGTIMPAAAGSRGFPEEVTEFERAEEEQFRQRQSRGDTLWLLWR